MNFDNLLFRFGCFRRGKLSSFSIQNLSIEFIFIFRNNKDTCRRGLVKNCFPAPVENWSKKEKNRFFQFLYSPKNPKTFLRKSWKNRTFICFGRIHNKKFKICPFRVLLHYCIHSLLLPCLNKNSKFRTPFYLHQENM